MNSPLRLLSVINPARDEDGCIASTVEHLHLELDLRGVPHEIIVVDDGSKDRTWSILQEEAKRLNYSAQSQISEVRSPDSDPPDTRHSSLVTHHRILHCVQNPGPHGFVRAEGKRKGEETKRPRRPPRQRLALRHSLRPPTTSAPPSALRRCPVSELFPTRSRKALENHRTTATPSCKTGLSQTPSACCRPTVTDQLSCSSSFQVASTTPIKAAVKQAVFSVQPVEIAHIYRKRIYNLRTAAARL